MAKRITGVIPEMVELLQERFVTKGELMELFNMSDRVCRATVQVIKRSYPVISTSNHVGYKIATSEADLPLVEDSLRNNKAKAISIFEGQKQLKAFYKKFKREDFEQLMLEL